MTYEREGALGWSLPGYGAELDEDTQEHIGPDETQSELSWSLEEKSEGSPVMSDSKISPKQTVITAPPTPFQNPVPRSQLIRPPRATGYPNTAPLAQPSSRSEPACKKGFIDGKPPDAVVRFSAAFNPSFKQYSKTARRPEKTLASTVAREKVQRIGIVTNTWIELSNNGDRCLYIWGKRQNAEQAKKQILQLIEQMCPSTDFKPVETLGIDTRHWGKLRARDIHGKHLNSKGYENKALDKLCRVPESNEPVSQTTFPWPLQGSSVENGLGKNSEKLDQIRNDFDIKIQFCPRDEEFLLGQGYKDTDIEEILDRLEALREDTVAKLAIDVKVYLVDPIPQGTMRTKVLMVKKKGCGFNQPYLCGHAVDPLPLGYFLEENDSILKENNKLLANGFHEALKKSQSSASNLRMRVHFGCFVYDTHRRPGNNQSAYLFPEFRSMIWDPKTRGRLLPGLRLGEDELLSRCIQAGDIFEPFDPEQSISDVISMAPEYSMAFAFSDQSNSPIHLEIRYNRDAGLSVPGNSRWLQTGRGQNSAPQRFFALQVGVFDFSKSDWQGDIEHFEAIPAKRIGRKFLAFAESVSSMNTIKSCNITSKPCKKVTFKDQPFLRSIVEKAAIQLRVKGTNYIFELARFDYYRKMQSQWIEKPQVSWGASLFDPAWNRYLGTKLLSKNSYRGPEPYEGLACLFPPANSDEYSAHNEKGFCEFLEIVRHIAGILGPGEGWSGMDPDYRDQTSPLDVDLGLIF